MSSSNSERRVSRGIPGLPTDAFGGATFDPTGNTKDLVEASIKGVGAVLKMRAKLVDEKVEGIRKNMDSMKELEQLRAAHQETLRTSDLDRLDKTRQVDVLAASASAAALATAVQTLASTADRNADALRNLVNATAQTMAKQTSDQAATLSAATDSLVKDINARIAELQKSSYQGSGKSSVTDPQMAEFVAEMKKLASSVFERQGRESVIDPAIERGMTAMASSIKELVAVQNIGAGNRGGIDQTWKWIFAAAALLFGFLQWESRNTQPIQVVMPQATPSITTTVPAPQYVPIVPK